MLLLDDALLLYRNRNHHSLSEYLKHHLKHVHNLQYQNSIDIRTICEHLNQQLLEYANTYSPVYKTHKGIIDKSRLMNKSDWYVKNIPAHAATTGGSTTGDRFHYTRWATHYNEIEGDLHYKAILKEFKLEKPINILYLMLDLTEDRNSDTLTKVYHTSNILISHGQGPSATIHEVIRNRTYYNDYFGFYEAIFKYCTDNSIDVILAPGQVISALAWNSRRLHHTAPICNLLSNTGNKVHRSDLDSLVQNGVISNWCDHMRCWDGGITFMTCIHHTYHLIDGLAWVTSDNNKLISTDYYSLSSPFINYWNGDHGKIANSFQKCKCGRSYREFEITRTRSVVMADVHSHEVRNQILKTSVDASGIKRAEHVGSFLRIFTTRPYSGEERKQIRSILPALEINFITEEPNG
jgi:hypothetical protein